MLFLHGAIPGTDIFGLGRLDEVGDSSAAIHAGFQVWIRSSRSCGKARTASLRCPEASNRPLERRRHEAHAGQPDRRRRQFHRTHHRTVPQGSEPAGRETDSLPAELWSSEHHHLGRALAACRLLDRLRALVVEQHLGAGDRILSKPTVRPDSCLPWPPICSARHRSRDERRSSNCSLPHNHKVRTHKPFTTSIHC